jgi:hypothetical protein
MRASSRARNASAVCLYGSRPHQIHLLVRIGEQIVVDVIDPEIQEAAAVFRGDRAVSVVLLRIALVWRQVPVPLGQHISIQATWPYHEALICRVFGLIAHITPLKR